MKKKPVDYRAILLAILLGIQLLSLTAFAQDVDENITLNEAPSSEKKLTNGWSPLLRVNAHFALGTSSDVIGQQNGDSITLGGTLEGGYFFKNERNEWRNTLDYNASSSKTPSVPAFIKSNDLLRLESLYLRSLEQWRWMGPYAQATLQTPVFKGEDVRSEVTTYVVQDTGQTTTSDTYRLTDPFKPLRTKESVGLFARLIDTKETRLVGRLGFGALQVSADGQLALDDDKNTAAMELKQLNSYDYVGTEAALDFSGSFDNKTSYSLKAAILVPFSVDTDPQDDRSELELADVEIRASIMSKVYDWASLNYEISFIKQPLLQERFQTASLFTVNFSHQLL